MSENRLYHLTQSRMTSDAWWRYDIESDNRKFTPGRGPHPPRKRLSLTLSNHLCEVGCQLPGCLHSWEEPA